MFTFVNTDDQGIDCDILNIVDEDVNHVNVS